MDKIAANITDSHIETTPTSTTAKQILNAKEVSEIFFQGFVSYDKVLRMTKSGDLPRLPIPNRYLYRLDILEEWARKNQKTTPDYDQADLQIN